MSNRAILVTGASTGIGAHLTARLAGLGHTVFATARKRADLARLAEIEHVVPIELDLTLPGAIDRAVHEVESRGVGLYGLVNNAGLGGVGFFSTWSDAELLEIFEVNALAPIKLARACLPLLLASRGRIVNIGSQGGSISMRYYGPYTMTKHALEAMTVSLDDELRQHGVRVSIVQPGGIVSAIGENGLPGTAARFRRAGPPSRRKRVLTRPSQSAPAEDEPDQPPIESPLARDR
ncbi:MAG: SDR family NAD(P)-dependent oxidoreductase [Candidatus Eisenbacteria bacterium]